MPIALMDGVRRGIMIPAGMARLDVRYRPAALRTGMAFSVAGVVVFLLILLDAEYRHVRPRRRVRPPRTVWWV